MKQILISRFLSDNIGINSFCKECRESGEIITTPLTPYLVPSSNDEPNEKILFVGKVARGDSIGEMVAEKLEDVTSFGEEYLKESSWAFYAYTREILEKYYGSLDIAISHVSFSNMVKCNNESTNDTTPWETKICCIEKNRFIWKEIEILKPKRIIFYTHYYYDYFIKDFLPDNCMYTKDITNDKNRIKIGNRSSLFWHRNFYNADNKIICSFLRVSHPMMKKKDEFVNAIVTWLEKYKK